MSDLEIVAVDPQDAAAFDAWHAAYLAAERHGRSEVASPWQRGELAAEWRAEQDHTTYAVLAGRGGPALLGGCAAPSAGEGHRFALITVARTWGSAPRPPRSA